MYFRLQFSLQPVQLCCFAIFCGRCSLHALCWYHWYREVSPRHRHRWTGGSPSERSKGESGWTSPTSGFLRVSSAMLFLLYFGFPRLKDSNYHLNMMGKWLLRFNIARLDKETGCAPPNLLFLSLVSQGAGALWCVSEDRFSAPNSSCERFVCLLVALDC